VEDSVAAAVACGCQQALNNAGTILSRFLCC